MATILPILLIALSLLLTGTMAGIASNNDGQDAQCHEEVAQIGESSVISGDNAFGLAPQSSVASADGLLASINVDDANTDNDTLYLVEARNEEGQLVVGFFTPLNGDASETSPGTLNLDQGLRLVKSDYSSVVELQQASESESVVPCSN